MQVPNADLISKLEHVKYIKYRVCGIHIMMIHI